MKLLCLLFGLGCAALAPVPAIIPAAPAVAAEPGDPLAVPIAARPYQRTMIREARAVWGLAAPVALFGAQVQTESAWRPNARSPYAAGLAQFIPATAAAISRKYPETLGEGDPLNPQWAIRALVQYDHDIFVGRFVNAVPPATECDRWAFTLSGYNGGEGWINRDRALCRQHSDCDPSRWWNNVELYSGRSESNYRQNRDYPVRILMDYQPNYRAWGGYLDCGG